MGTQISTSKDGRSGVSHRYGVWKVHMFVSFLYSTTIHLLRVLKNQHCAPREPMGVFAIAIMWRRRRSECEVWRCLEHKIVGVMLRT